MLKNPVMLVVWIGTIVTALLTIDPTLFGPVLGKNQVVFNGLVTLILFFTLVFANFVASFPTVGCGFGQAADWRNCGF
jgi:K+-transporting ATPase ATPase B chain